MKTLTAFFVLFFGLNIGLVHGQNPAGNSVGSRIAEQKNENETSWVNLKNKAKKYYNNKDYTSAIIFGEKALNQAEKEFGKSHYNYANSLNDLGLFYEFNNEYKKAEPLYKHALEISKSGKGVLYNSPYSDAINNLKYLYNKMGQPEEAIFLAYRDTLERTELKYGKNHSEYRKYLHLFGISYQALEHFDRALPVFLEELENVKRNLGENDSAFGNALQSIADLYQLSGNYKEAEPYYLTALKNTIISLGESHYLYGTRLNNLALLYKKMGRYEEAIPIAKQALDNTKKSLGITHSAYGGRLSILANLYMTIGRYDDALLLYLEAVKNAENNGKEDNYHYADNINDLAILYAEMGRYEDALPLYKESLRVVEKRYGKNNSSYGIRLNNLAVFYLSLGRCKEALPLFLEALQNCKKNLGVNHPEYGTSLNNLGSVYNCLGRYSDALIYHKEALKNIEQNLGKEHPDYGSRLNNLATTMIEIGQYDEAIPILIEAIENTKKSLGENHPDYGQFLKNLGTIYADMGQYEFALPLLKESLDNYKINLGEEHLEYGISLNNLALLYQSMGKYSDAFPLFVEATNNIQNHVSSVFSFSSEKGKEDFLKTQASLLACPKSFAFKTHSEYIELNTLIIDNELFIKGLVLNSTLNIKTILEKNNDKTIQNEFEKWKKQKMELAFQYGLPIYQRVSYIDSLEVEADNSEQKLVALSSEFKEQKMNLEVKSFDIETKIISNEVAIEFISFSYFSKDWTDSTIYAALLLKKGAEYPDFIFQFEEKQLKTLISQNKVEEKEQNQPLYSSNADSSDIYHLIWQPLEPYLKGIDKIYFSPSGMLHSIDLQAIQTPDGKRLGEKYNMVQMSTTRNVVSTSGEPDKDSITLFGGIDYDFKPVGKDSLSNPDSDFHKPDLSTANRGGTEYFSALPETKKEIEQIQQQFEANKNQSTLITGAQATEEAFKSLSGKSPKILHISTHGFFFPDVEKKKEDKRMLSLEEDKSVFKISDNPLLRSGLIMAHGNYVWQKGSNPYEKEDGILTAYEIANLNLSNTDLVVLSACETGLGEIKGSEGVFGLQRAFKMAGVDYLMMSLWKVPDKETKEFMQLFYSNWLGGMKIRDAFRNTQLTMSKTYPNDPYKWAAFVLVE